MIMITDIDYVCVCELPFSRGLVVFWYMQIKFSTKIINNKVLHVHVVSICVV